MYKRTLAATGLLVWAGALQAHMWYVTSTDEYKQSTISKAGDATDWSFSFGSSKPSKDEDK